MRKVGVRKLKAENRRQESGAPERTRTSDARFRKPTLYPLSYGGKKDADNQLCYLNTPLLPSKQAHKTTFSRLFDATLLRHKEKTPATPVGKGLKGTFTAGGVHKGTFIAG